MKTATAIRLPHTLNHLALAALCCMAALPHPVRANGTSVAPAPVQHSRSSPAAAADAKSHGQALSDTEITANKIKAILQNQGGKKADDPHAAARHSAAPAARAMSHGTIRTAAAAPGTHARALEAIQNGHAAPEAHGAAGHAPHWSYEGEFGPENWAKVKPEFNMCTLGKRQSPVHIQDTGTLQGPAEPLQFDYRPSGGTVVNNGHTIQVDLEPGNTMSVRGSTYQLLQFHFHHPSEERVNYKGFSMVAHLVHKNYEGQLAVVAVLMDPGLANELINKVWTHMPLDSGDRVRLPAGLIDVRELLPKDQRYYQFIGSLTTPPCTEGVLWNVLKTPVTLSKDQLVVLLQLFPMNARPVQPLNARVVREAQ